MGYEGMKKDRIEMGQDRMEWNGTGQGLGQNGIGWDGMGWEGKWKGSGWDGKGWDWTDWIGLRYEGMDWDGMEWDGIGIGKQWDREAMGQDGIGQ